AAPSRCGQGAFAPRLATAAGDRGSARLDGGVVSPGRRRGAAVRRADRALHGARAMKCRFCAAPLSRVFCDLGLSPLSNNYIDPKSAGKEARYPLCAYLCERCLLVQLEAFETPAQIFSDYAYFSSYSDSWLAHCRAYAYATRERLALGPRSLVVEV